MIDNTEHVLIANRERLTFDEVNDLRLKYEDIKSNIMTFNEIINRHNFVEGLGVIIQFDIEYTDKEPDKFYYVCEDS